MMNNPAAAEEGEYTTVKTSVWWDIENCQVPKGWDANGIAQRLSSELMKMNYNGPLSISSYGNTDLIPNSVQQALSSTGVSLNHVPSGRKDASDKKILVDLFLWVLDNPPPANIMLISGDGDFSYALHRLRMMRYNILLAHTQNAPAPLVASAKTTWLWRTLMANGCTSTQCESDISSEDVSEPMDLGSGYSGTVENKPKGVVDLSEASNQKEKRNRPPKKDISDWCCTVCNVDCQSHEAYFTHFRSKEHAAQLDLRQNLELLDELENMVTTLSECHEKDKKTSSNSKASKQADPSKLKNSEPVVKNKSSPKFCETCKVSCTSLVDFKSHLSSKKHKKKAATVVVETAHGKPKTEWCSICKSHYPTSGRKVHISGRKHKNKVKLQTP